MYSCIHPGGKQKKVIPTLVSSTALHFHTAPFLEFSFMLLLLATIDMLVCFAAVRRRITHRLWRSSRHVPRHPPTHDPSIPLQSFLYQYCIIRGLFPEYPHKDSIRQHRPRPILSR